MTDDLSEKVAVLTNELEHNNALTAELLEVLKGKNGLVIKVALNTNSISYFKYWIGTIWAGLLSIVFWIIKKT